ncbi:MAG: M28 family metallopeptidase [Actinomycetota bacterium]
MGHIRKLATGIGVRVRATNAEREGASYIRGRFRHFGYRTKIQKFDVDGGRSRNVVAWWPGSVRHGVVVGAHMDSVAGSPGANDNASGIAVTLELARLSAGKKPARFVRWVAFGSEEYGSNGRHHVGSQVYVNRMGDKGRRRLAGMLSVDMVADGRPLLVGTSGIGPEVAARHAYERMRRVARTEYRTFCDCSDNGPFERAGIPAAFAWSGYEPDYHESTDTAPNLRKRHVKRTGRTAKAFVTSINRKVLRRFRRAR